jgi:hypothetical protein
MSRKPPPVTDADRWQLSRAMLALAGQAEEISDELVARGYDRPGAIVRAALLNFAERVASREGLRAYWRELTKEFLSALDAPNGGLDGHYVAPYDYQSLLIAELRSKAHLLPIGPGGSSPQIEPAIKAWVEELGTTHADKDGLVELTREAAAEAAASLGVPERPEFAALDWRGRMALQRERYAQTLVSAGFRLVAPSRGFTHFQRRTTDGKYVFSLIDDFNAMGMYGRLTPEFAITWPGTQITSAKLYSQRLCEFLPEHVVPEFHWSCAFEKNSWPELCLVTDTVACLTTILFRRLDAALQNKSI